MVKVAIYTRLSSDPTGTQTATARQDTACRALAAAREWEVWRTFEDVDYSAFKPGVVRPGYEEMLEAVRERAVDGILVWKLDRLVRRPAEFERLWSTCERAGVFLASATEPIDSSSDLGLAMVRILVTFASLESATTSLRLRARNEQLARQGRPPACTRAYGFSSDWSSLVPGEAAVIRDAAARILAGESAGSVARDLTARGIRSPRGAMWKTSTLTRLLRMPRLVGDRTYRGEIVVRDLYPAILSREVFGRLAVVLAKPGRPAQCHLLSGLAVCGLCGGRLYVFRLNKVRSYVCVRDNGCGRLAVVADRAEDVVVQRVLRRLARQPLRRPAVPEPATDAELNTFARQVSALYNQRRQRAISHTDYLEARRRIAHKLERALPTAAREVTADNGAWQELTLAQQHGVLVEMLERVTVEPAPRRGYFDPNRIRLTWWSPDDATTTDVPQPTLRRALLTARRRPPGDASQWCSLVEACEIVGGLSQRSICQLVIDGELPASHTGNVLWFLRRDLTIFVASSRL